MRRREFIKLLAGATAWPLAARAQQAMPTLGVVSIAGREATFNAIWYKAFWERMLDHGWAPGRNFSIEYRFADHRPSLLPDLVKDLISRKPDAIFVPTRPALPAVKEATTSIPVVFVSLGDPIAEGWISGLARPEGNLTGIAGLSPELAGKRLELLRELVPSLTKIAVLRNPANRTEEVAILATQTSAQKLGMSVTIVTLSDPGEFDNAIAALAQIGIESIIVPPDPMFNEHRSKLVQLIAQSRIPAIYMETGFVAEGGLISYGPNLKEMFRRSADFVDKILRGAKPADLPVEQPTTFELILNLKAAHALGLTVAPSILLRATEIIE
jgi:putative tryptophan/tyrosine transport system substrate-binding protein